MHIPGPYPCSLNQMLTAQNQESAFFFPFCLFRAKTLAYEGSQARGQIRAIATSLHQRHSNTESKQRLQPAPQPMAMPDP